MRLPSRRRFAGGGLSESDPNFEDAMNSYFGAGGYDANDPQQVEQVRQMVMATGYNDQPHGKPTVPYSRSFSMRPKPVPAVTGMPRASPDYTTGLLQPPRVPYASEPNPLDYTTGLLSTAGRASPSSASDAPAPVSVPETNTSPSSTGGQTPPGLHQGDKNYKPPLIDIQNPWLRALAAAGMGGVFSAGAGPGALGGAGIAALLSYLANRKRPVATTYDENKAQGGPIGGDFMGRRAMRFQLGGGVPPAAGGSSLGPMATAPGIGGMTTDMAQLFGVNPATGMADPGARQQAMGRLMALNAAAAPGAGGGPPPGAIQPLAGGPGAPGMQNAALAGMNAPPPPGGASLGALGGPPPPMPPPGMGAASSLGPPAGAPGMQNAALAGMLGGMGGPPPGGPGMQNALAAMQGGPPPMPPLGGGASFAPMPNPGLGAPGGFGGPAPGAMGYMGRRGLPAGAGLGTSMRPARPYKKGGAIDVEKSADGLPPALVKKAKGVLTRKPKGPAVSIAILNKKKPPVPTPSPYDMEDEGSPAPMMAKGGKFIQSAIKKPGALHKQLGVPQGQKIPAKKLAAAAGKGGKLGQRARFAQTLKGLHKNKGGKCDKMAAGGAAKQRKGFPNTEAPSKPKTFASGGKVRGCGVAQRGCGFSGIY
jgi:hypothetical protein